MFCSVPLPRLLKTLLDREVTLPFPRGAVLGAQAAPYGECSGLWRAGSPPRRKVTAGARCKGCALLRDSRSHWTTDSVAEKQQKNPSSTCFMVCATSSVPAIYTAGMKENLQFQVAFYPAVQDKFRIFHWRTFTGLSLNSSMFS